MKKFIIRRLNVDTGARSLYPTDNNPAVYDDEDTAENVAVGLNLCGELWDTPNFFEVESGVGQLLPEYGETSRASER
jgi:hypothetical protein